MSNLADSDIRQSKASEMKFLQSRPFCPFCLFECFQLDANGNWPKKWKKHSMHERAIRMERFHRPGGLAPASMPKRTTL